MDAPFPISFLTALAAALCALAAAPDAARAQTPPGGVLGQRFVDVNFDAIDYRGISENGYSTGVSVNLPATPNVDLGLGYGYGWIDLPNRKVQDQSLSAAATWHGTAPGLKPFATAAAGYDWSHERGSAARANDGTGFGVVAVGVELTVGPASLTPVISYTDLTIHHGIGAMHYGVEGNYWLTSELAGYSAITFTDFNGHNGSCWATRVGLRFRF